MNIDWTDERAIGLTCWFWDDDHPSKVLGELIHVEPTEKLPFSSRETGTNGVLRGIYQHCRIAQGEKTPYDGKGQPVPDGVLVKLWGGDSVEPFDEELAELQLKLDEQIACSEELPEDKTVPIKQSTIDEIVECLEDARDATNELLGLELQVIHGNKRRAKIYQEEIATIDKLIKELKDKQ